MEIKVSVKGLPLRPIEEFEAFQGNLKKLEKEDAVKLRKSIERNGFNAPIYVWAGHNYILDGHQRLDVIRSMLREGWTLRGGGLPYVEIEAESEKAAAEMVLTYNSQYGHITEAGLKEFVDSFDLVIPELKEIITVDLGPLEFEPALMEAQGKLDQLDPKTDKRCPTCGKPL